MQPNDYMPKNEAMLFEFLTSGNRLASKDYPDRKNNNSPEMITLLQQTLEKRGYLPKGSDDGVFGAATHDALINMQGDMNISTIGIAGEEFANKLSHLNILEARQRGKDPQKGEDFPTIQLLSSSATIVEVAKEASPYIKTANVTSQQAGVNPINGAMRDDCVQIRNTILSSGVEGGQDVSHQVKRANVECLMDSVTKIER